MPAMSPSEIRRTNLRKLIEQRGGPNVLGATLGYANGSFLVQMAGPNPIREVTERTARKFEQILNLPDGWFDREEVAVAPPPAFDTEMVRNAIQATAKAIEDAGLQMTPTKIGNLATMAYADAVEHGGVRKEYISQLLQLLQ